MGSERGDAGQPADGGPEVLGIVPKLGWPRAGRDRSQIWSFAINASGKLYGFVAEIDPAKLSRSGLSGRDLAAQARAHAVEVMRSRGHDPDQIRATSPRRIEQRADPAELRYCQYFDFGPHGGSVLFLNRPPAGEPDHLADSAFAAETSGGDPG